MKSLILLPSFEWRSCSLGSKHSPKYPGIDFTHYDILRNSLLINEIILMHEIHVFELEVETNAGDPHSF